MPSELLVLPTEIADEMGFDRLVSNQPQYSMLYRVIEERVVPASRELGIGQIVWSPIAQGVLTGTRGDLHQRIFGQQSVVPDLRFYRVLVGREGPGLGNDFVVFDGVRQRVVLVPETIRKLADRRFGVGCDQVLLVEGPTQPGIDFRYRIFNCDESTYS